MDHHAFAQFLYKGQLVFEFGFRNEVKIPFCRYHSHDSFELVYHLKGDGIFASSGGENVHFDEKSIVIHAPGVRHSQTTRVPGEDACIHFSAPGNMSALLGEYYHVQPFDDPNVANDILSLTDGPSPISTLEKAACNHRISAIIARLLGSRSTQTGQAQTLQPDYASAAFAHLREKLGTIANLESVAAALGVSYDHLRHLFKEKFGKSMKEQLSELRFDKSKQLLAQTPLPLKAIADLCGYTSDRYFCMAFKTAQGMTPGEFRAKYRS